MEKIEFAVLAGDGNGPDIVAETINLLQSMEKFMELRFDFRYELIGEAGLKITRRTLPKDALKLCRESDAVLIGSLERSYAGDIPKEKSPLEALKVLRKALGIFYEHKKIHIPGSIASPNPSNDNKQYHELKIFRETSGGISFPDKGRKNQGATAYDTLSYSDNQIKRIARQVFRESINHDHKIFLVDHTESMETSRLWRESVKSLENEFPEISVIYMDVKDALTSIYQNPGLFTIILIENLLGDFLIKLAELRTHINITLPSLWYGPAAVLFDTNTRPFSSLFQKDRLNPFTSYLTAAMILDHFGQPAHARSVRSFVYQSIAQESELNVPLLTENYSSEGLNQKLHNFLTSNSDN